MRKIRLNMDIDSLWYDINRRDHLNKLINDLERTFKDSTSIRKTWNLLRLQYGKLGKTLYGFAAIVGLAGFPLLIVSSQSVTLLSTQHCSLLWVLLVIVGIIFLILILHIRGKIISNLKIYKKAKEKYLIDELRIRK